MDGAVAHPRAQHARLRRPFGVVVRLRDDEGEHRVAPDDGLPLGFAGAVVDVVAPP
jgi:hypothetical protein